MATAVPKVKAQTKRAVVTTTDSVYHSKTNARFPDSALLEEQDASAVDDDRFDLAYQFTAANLKRLRDRPSRWKERHKLRMP